jgi:hypothetical protein
LFTVPHRSSTVSCCLSSECNAPPPRVVALCMTQLVVLACIRSSHVQQQLEWPRGPSGQTSYAGSRLFYCPTNHPHCPRCLPPLSSFPPVRTRTHTRSRTRTRTRPTTHSNSNSLSTALVYALASVPASVPASDLVLVLVPTLERTPAASANTPSQLLVAPLPPLVLVYHLAADSRVSRAPAADRALRPLPTALRSPLSFFPR